MSTKKKGWPKIGSIRVGENKETKEKYTYMKLEDNVEITVGGEKVALNKYRTLRFERPVDEVNSLYEKGHITEKQRDERLESLSDKTSWLKYNVKAPSPQD